MSSYLLIYSLGRTLIKEALLLFYRNILESSALACQVDECIQVLKVLRSQKPMAKLLVLAHLVSVAEAPTLHA